MSTSTVLIVGATRGLGASLVRQYVARAGTTVFGTTRSNIIPSGFPVPVKWLPGIDLMNQDAGDRLVKLLKDPHTSPPLSTVIITAGHFTTEDLTAEKGPSWDEEQRMYTTSSIAPVFLVHRLVHAGLLASGSRVVLVSSESGSIALRHEKEGGGNYAHHASKAALNMVGKLLSLDLKDKGVVVSIVHPGFMRTEMTAGVGFDKYWDDGGGTSAFACLCTYPCVDQRLRHSRHSGRGGQELGRVGRRTRHVQVGRVLGPPGTPRHWNGRSGAWQGSVDAAASPVVITPCHCTEYCI